MRLSQYIHLNIGHLTGCRVPNQFVMNLTFLSETVDCPQCLREIHKHDLQEEAGTEVLGFMSADWVSDPPLQLRVSKRGVVYCTCWGKDCEHLLLMRNALKSQEDMAAFQRRLVARQP